MENFIGMKNLGFFHPPLILDRLADLAFFYSPVKYRSFYRMIW